MNILRTEQLTKRFGGVVANDNLSINIQKGKITALIGPNGSGKTTFINVVTGVHPATSGKIFFNDLDITELEINTISRKDIATNLKKFILLDQV